MMRAATIAVAIVMSACRISGDHYVGDDGGANGDAGDDAGVELPSITHSGSRLQLIEHTFPDGTKRPQGIHDSQLNADCGPSPWQDGGMFCTPFTGTVLFADSTCTTPVIHAYAGTQGTLFGTASDATGVSHVYLAGNPTVTQAYFDTGTSCVTDSASNLFEVAREVMPSELVAMSITTEDLGAYSNIYMHGADGLLTLDDTNVLHDNTRATDCYVNSQGPGWPKSYCIPLTAAYTATYSDASCTQPIVATPDATTSVAAVFARPAYCPVVSEIRAIGSSIGVPAQTFAFDFTSGACTARGAGSGTFVSLGAAMTLPALDHRPAAQPGRRVENGTITGGGQSFLQRDFYDTTLGTWCSVREMPDGQLVCIPEGVNVQSMFGDASCTQSIAIVDWAGVSACGEAFPPYGVESVGNSIKVRAVLQASTGPLYQMTTSCVPVSTVGHRYQPTGDPLPLAMFATATLVTEPTVP